MKKTEIVQAFLSRGLQVGGDALDFFIENPEKLKTFFSKTITHPQTVGLDFVKEALGGGESLRIIKTNIAKEKADVESFIEFFNKRHMFLSRIIGKRLDLVNLVSINKISEKIKKFSIIGMVKEKDSENKTIVIEDRSGEAEIVLSSDNLSQIVEDEVVGIVCEKRGQLVYGEKIIFPDIPIQKDIGRTKEDTFVLAISDIHMDSEAFDKKAYDNLINWLKNQQKLILFIVGDISSKKEDVEKLLSDIPSFHDVFIVEGEIDSRSERMLPSPAFFQIENVKLLMFHNKKLTDYINLWGSPEKAIVNLIKKRHLDPTFSPNTKLYDNDPYLLDGVPDIIVAAHSHTPITTNYKGITILTTGSFVSQPIFWLINLRTRETFKMDFS